jgi:hypothetical protein
VLQKETKARQTPSSHVVVDFEMRQGETAGPEQTVLMLQPR